MAAVVFSVLVFREFCDILQFAMQNRAELAERIGADIFVFSQAVKLSAAEMVFIDELVLRNAALPHGLPQTIIYDHKNHPSVFFMIVTERHSIDNSP